MIFGVWAKKLLNFQWIIFGRIIKTEFKCQEGDFEEKQFFGKKCKFTNHFQILTENFLDSWLKVYGMVVKTTFCFSKGTIWVNFLFKNL